MQRIEPGISRFRVWSFGPSRNDELIYGISYTTILSAMPRSAACFWIGLIASLSRIAATAGDSITGPVIESPAVASILQKQAIRPIQKEAALRGIADKMVVYEIP